MCAHRPRPGRIRCPVGRSMILGSAEYDTAFLQAVYHDILGRPLDSASAAGWSTALAQLDHASVAALILASPEAQADRIQAGYQGYLHRPPDPAADNRFGLRDGLRLRR